MAKSPLATLKYFSTLLVCALALAAGWWLWNYYMQGPWTRDGKVRAELVSITPEVSGKIVSIWIKDNQLVTSWDAASLKKRFADMSSLVTGGSQALPRCPKSTHTARYDTDTDIADVETRETRADRLIAPLAPADTALRHVPTAHIEHSEAQAGR